MGLELQILTKHVDHIKDIVTMQQTYAKVSASSNPCPWPVQLEDALQVSRCSFPGTTFS